MFSKKPGVGIEYKWFTRNDSQRPGVRAIENVIRMETGAVQLPIIDRFVQSCVKLELRLSRTKIYYHVPHQLRVIAGM